MESAALLGVAAAASRWQLEVPLGAIGMNESEERLVLQRLARGELGALRALYDRFSRRIQALAMHVLKDPGEAEDMVQETLLEVWKRREEFDPSRVTVSAWLLTIARSRSLTRRQSRQSAQRRDSEAANDERTEAPRALVLLEGREDSQRLARAMAALPPDQRQVIQLAYFEGLSHSEIAERLSEPLGTVKTRVRLGMQKMSALLLAGGGRDVR